MTTPRYQLPFASLRVITLLIILLTNSFASAQVTNVSTPDRNSLPPDVAAALATTSTKQIKVGSTLRDYRLHLPKGMKPATASAVVLVFHGLGANGEITEMITGFDVLADTEAFIVAYPEGVGRQWDISSPNSQDTAFVKQLMAELVSDQNGDPKRIFATGISMGAWMTNRLGLELNGEIRAIAPVAGTLPTLVHNAARSKLTGSLPAIYFHGTKDEVLGIDGTDTFSKSKLSLSSQQFVDYLVTQNKCKATPVTVSTPDAAMDHTTIDTMTYSGGTGDVVFVKIIGGGHTWPGGYAQPTSVGSTTLGKTTANINATARIWEFFKTIK